MGTQTKRYPPHAEMKRCFFRALKNKETLVEQSETVEDDFKRGEVPGRVPK